MSLGLTGLLTARSGRQIQIREMSDPNTGEFLFAQVEGVMGKSHILSPDEVDDVLQSYKDSIKADEPAPKLHWNKNSMTPEGFERVKNFSWNNNSTQRPWEIIEVSETPEGIPSFVGYLELNPGCYVFADIVKSSPIIVTILGEVQDTRESAQPLTQDTYDALRRKLQPLLDSEASHEDYQYKFSPESLMNLPEVLVKHYPVAHIQPRETLGTILAEYHSVKP